MNHDSCSFMNINNMCIELGGFQKFLVERKIQNFNFFSKSKRGISEVNPNRTRPYYFCQFRGDLI